MNCSTAVLGLAVFALACSNPNPPCEAPDTECSSSCVYLQSDPANCGACGNACQGSAACVAGVCQGAQVQPTGSSSTSSGTSGTGTGGTTGTSSATTSGGTTSGGTTGATTACRDGYAVCWNNGGVIPFCAGTLSQGQTGIIEAPAAGGGVGPVVGQLGNAVFTDAHTLWLLDEANDQIDVLDTTVWPPTATAAIATGVGPYDPVQLALCGGKVAVLRQITAVVQLFDPSLGPGTQAATGEVSLASASGSQNPEAMACDGNHTLYVTDNENQTVTAVDVTAAQVGAQTTLPAQDLPAALPDGGTIDPSLAPVAYAKVGDGGYVLVALQNLGPDYNPAADATVFALDPQLQKWSAPIDPGASCQNAWSLVPSADQSTLYAACAGTFSLSGPLNSTASLGVTKLATLVAEAPVQLGLSNPGSAALLGSGVIAVADLAQSRVAFYNPADGGVSSLDVACPAVDAGAQFVSAVVAAP